MSQIELSSHDARCLDWYKRLIVDGLAEDGQRIAVMMEEKCKSLIAENEALCKEYGDLADGMYTAHKAKEYKKQVDNLTTELEQYRQMEREGLLIRLPVPIGGVIYVTYEYDEFDGSTERGVEELHLSGYIKEGEREFYTTYDSGDTCDIPTAELYTTREAAEAALQRDNTEKEETINARD